MTRAPALAAALACILATPAAAQPEQCADREALVEHLKAKFGEHRTSLMLDNRGRMIELFRNPKTGSWTLLMTPPGMPSCLVLAGEHYAGDREEPEGESS